MKNAACYSKKCGAVVLSLLLVCSLFDQTWMMTTYAAQIQTIESCDLSDFTNWRSGMYARGNAAYTADDSQICLNDYKSVTQGKTYLVNMPDSLSDYCLVVRELTNDKKIVQTLFMHDGDGFTADSSVSYIAVYLYNTKRSDLTYQDYKALFQKGCNLSLTVSTEGKIIRDPNVTGPVLGFDWSDLSYWRIGMYQSSTGNYTFYQPRICLNDYVNATSGAMYRFESSADGRYYMQIREMTADKKFIQSVFLGKGESFVATKNTAYLAVSIGDGKGDHGNYLQYLKLFQDEWKIRLMKEGGTQQPSGGNETSKPENGNSPSIAAPSTPSNTVSSLPSTVETPSAPSSSNSAIIGKGNSYDLSAESNWKVGMYNFTDGLYTYTPTRICLQDYIKCVANATYELESSADARYYMSIRQMTADKKFIKTTFVGKGESFKAEANAAYFGVTIQNGKGDHWGYEDYKAQFDKGWVIRLICRSASGSSDVDDEDYTGGTDVPSSGQNVSTPSMEPLVPSKASVAPSKASTPSVAPSTAPSKASAPSVAPSKTETPSVAPSTPTTPTQNTSIEYLKSEMKRIVMNNSTEKIDIYRYNLKYAQMHKIWDQAMAEDFELQVAANCYMVMDFASDNDAKGVVKDIYIAYPDSNFKSRFQKAWTNVQTMCNFIKANPEMTTLDKVIYVHDYIVLHNFYRTTGTTIDYNGGAALAGEGSVCQGYRIAMGLMLDRLNIPNSIVSSSNHTWNYVKIDGNWYHLDATWAEGTPVKHTYLLRNDTEYPKPLDGRAHAAWKNNEGYTSTSTKYTNWFVHDIKGRMYYGGGYWYYKDGTKLMKAKSDGSDIQVIGDDTTAGKVLNPADYTPQNY